MQKIIPFIFFLLVSASISAQTELSAFTSTGSGYSTATLTDYQCLGVNPANLGWTWNNHQMNLGFLETGLSVFSEAMTKKQTTSYLMRKDTRLTFEERQQAAAAFNGKLTWSSLGITWAGFSWQDDKIGGFAISIRDRAQWSTIFNDMASNFLFLGFYDPYFDSLAVNLGDTTGYSTDPRWASEIYNGTKLNFIWYREYNFGYGRKIFGNEKFTLFGGFAVKYINGYGSFQYLQDGSDLTAYYSLSPVFGIENETPTPSGITGDGLKKVGDGFAFDLGISMLLFKKLRVGLAVNDIGSINWNGNVYSGNNTSVWKINSSGITNFNIFEQGKLIQSNNAPNDPGLWQGLANKKTELSTNFRGGVAYRFSEKLELGADLYMPLKQEVPGSYEKEVIGAGVKFDPARWFQLSAGVVSGGNYGTNLPVGFTFFPVRNDNTTWQVGLATRDVISFFKEELATVSVAFGLIRVSFGPKRR